MYSVKPLGINIRQNDREVRDGYLQESINLQWRDGSYKPIPKRILSDINTTLYGRIILHKVGDEDQINVLGFSRSSYGFLAEDLSAYLGGGEDTLYGDLTWFGTIIDGAYTVKEFPVVLPVKRTPGMSWTILNGLLYFMGNGTIIDERYYKRLQYNSTDESYDTKDMYAWKSLIPFYPEQVNIKALCPKKTWNIVTQCGFVLTRFTLVLKTGEEVLHSPIYFNYMFGINRSTEQFSTETTIKNIHTVINLDLEFLDNDLLDEEIAAINVYTSVPYYINKIPVESLPTEGIIPAYRTIYLIDRDGLKGEVQKSAEQPFYLVKTLDKPTSEQLVLTAGQLDTDLDFVYDSDSTDVEYSKVDIITIAAGQSMPVDNYSYHDKYGSITSYNGRIIIEQPLTVLGDGHIRSLALNSTESYSTFKMDTEDGKVTKLSSILDKSITLVTNVYGDLTINSIFTRGMLSYPDLKANTIGVNSSLATSLYNFKCRKNKFHNMSCVFDFVYIGTASLGFGEEGDDAAFVTNYLGKFIYMNQNDENVESPDGYVSTDNYTSENAVQFSAIGEYSVWPAENNYRIGDGKIMKVGANNVDQKSANIVSMLIVGTTDGVWSINTDPTGNNLVSSITRISRIPYISKEVLQVEGTFFFISDKGLMAIDRNNEPQPLSYDFFPGLGDGILPTIEDVLPNYTILTEDYFNGSTYVLTDITSYLKQAKLAYDSRRNAIWCSNPYEDFSLVYDIKNRCWGMSTIVFAESIEFFSTMATNTTDVYSWYLVMDNNSLQPYLMILSGEDMETEVIIHMLTRPIKFNERTAFNEDRYKKIQRMFARCELFRDNNESGYFTFGVWGKQDINKYKENIPVIALLDNSQASFPDNVRQDIPVGSRKGKYKSLSVLIGGQLLPDSSIDRIDFEAALVDNTLMR